MMLQFYNAVAQEEFLLLPLLICKWGISIDHLAFTTSLFYQKNAFHKQIQSISTSFLTNLDAHSPMPTHRKPIFDISFKIIPFLGHKYHICPRELPNGALQGLKIKNNFNAFCMLMVCFRQKSIFADFPECGSRRGLRGKKCGGNDAKLPGNRVDAIEQRREVMPV